MAEGPPLSRRAGYNARMCVRLSSRFLPLLLLLLATLHGCRPTAAGGLLFASARSGNWEIYYQATPEAEPQNLTRYPSGERFPDWSPDRHQLVLASDRSGSFGLYLLEPDGNNLRLLTDSPYPDTSPRWSRRNQIVFVSERADRNEELYLVDAGGGEPRRLTQDPAPDYDPAWYPDGQSLVFVSLRSGSPELYRLDLASGTAQALTRDTADKRSPDVSPDGRQIVFARRPSGSDWQLVLLEPASGQTRILAAQPGWLGMPRWRNSDELLFAAEGAQGQRIYRLNLAEGKQVEVATGLRPVQVGSGKNMDREAVQ
ncbi:MAG: hypothetical protein CVV27_11665 [Candidatus Melainabacteria bacterium HGW-Melainabacteria-1]|nr:MAG: hypothetical protein CVV27_11665 [Candidatus Melainabacteria bacterium HGW-Melainabacteria-1]